jgi:hypothetical protein
MCRWDEVEQFRARVTRTTVIRKVMFTTSRTVQWLYDYELRCPGTAPFRFASTTAADGVKSFGRRIQYETTRALLPLYRERFARGERLEFGPCALDREGVHYGRHGARWADLEAVLVARGFVNLYFRGGGTWEKIPFGEISHAIVFVALAEAAILAHGGGHSPQADNPFAL